ncbi:MAG: DUF1080 domain-containing protein [Verrucomicrobiota bacterium]
MKYFVHPNLDPVTGTSEGGDGFGHRYEYQVLDDARHPDAKLGRNGNRTVASLYDLLPAAASKHPKPIGEWNTARIVIRGNHGEHWLNGEKVLEYDRTSPEFRDARAQQIPEHPRLSAMDGGAPLLQEHGSAVSFRNIKIRPLSKP